ncbi:type IV toxin-antitoxin system AbiEi family antitoxin domain-containing protein [Microbacterium sp. 1P06AB]|uniref:type IV toxin-antitoxin system AbiEi family antitoxin domain-containing protein n=1 Tax=Microbacterium sp. 1P06AB TaxID=3132289 RepID=UPI0039A64F14
MSRSAVDVVVAHGGVARTSTLRAAGVTDAALRVAVRRGALVRARQGVYAVPGTSPVVLAALGCRGRLACVSAARHHGVWTLDGGPASPPHVWIDPDRHPSSVPPGFIVHRDGRGEPDALVAVRLAHCLAQITRCAGAEAFLCALESALRHRLLTRAELDGLRATVPVGIRPLIDIARGDADSGL